MTAPYTEDLFPSIPKTFNDIISEKKYADLTLQFSELNKQELIKLLHWSLLYLNKN